MLSLLKRKWKLAAVPRQEPVQEHGRRICQLNIKASKDCLAVFAALAHATGMSKAALFEDMVAERFEKWRRQGLTLRIA